MAARRTKKKKRSKRIKKFEKQLRVITQEVKNLCTHIQDLTTTLVKGNYRIM